MKSLRDGCLPSAGKDPFGIGMIPLTRDGMVPLTRNWMIPLRGWDGSLREGDESLRDGLFRTIKTLKMKCSNQQKYLLVMC